MDLKKKKNGLGAKTKIFKQTLGEWGNPWRVG